VSKSLIQEQKLFLILQACVLALMLVGLLLSANITISLPERAPATCGDGIANGGETAQNCCVDVGCEEGFACTESGCIKEGKQESIVFEEFVFTARTLISQAEAFVPAVELELTRELLSAHLQTLGEQGYDVSIEQNVYDIVTRHADTLVEVQAVNRRIQPVTSSDIYLRIILNDGFGNDEQKAQLKTVGNLAVSGLSDIERFITVLERMNPSTAMFLEEELSFDQEAVIEEYRLRQTFFDEVATQIDEDGLITYNSILDTEE
jgi:hypothetical protein